jgi:hypothetical protein
LELKLGRLAFAGTSGSAIAALDRTLSTYMGYV